jgi:integrase
MELIRKARRDRPDPPTTTEIARVLAEAWDTPPLGLILWLAISTGCRRKELCDLKWSQVDFAQAHVRIAQPTENPNVAVNEPDTTTAREYRISLGPTTLHLLQEHQNQVQQQMQKIGLKFSDEQYLFSDEPNYLRPITPNLITHRYRELANKHNIRSTRINALRQYNAPELITAGALPDTATTTAGPTIQQLRPVPRPECH